MTAGGLAYLVLVVVAAMAFMTTLGWLSMHER